MNKQEVADFLRVTTKSVERYAKSGKLKTVYVQGKAVFDKEEVENFKAELETPVHRALLVTETEVDKPELSLSVAPEASAMLMPVLHHLMQQLIQNEQNKHLSQRLTLNLDEAAAMSGFSKKGILNAAKQGNLVGVKQGGSWKFRPGDVTRFVDAYFEGNFEGKNGRNPLPNRVPEPTT